MKPHKCPVCNGSGKQSRPPWVNGDVDNWTTGGATTFACHACAGTGIVWSPEP